jgi:short-subunit dehydrogenase
MWVGPYEDEPEAAALKQMDVNFHGVARGMRLALPPMVARGRGHVVNVASAASRLVPAGEATYGATKHAVLGYCTAVRAELRGTGVELSVVMPVVVETELAAGTSHGRGPRLSVQDVADAVARTIDRPRFEVPVPGSVGLLMRLVAVLPQRARDLLWARAMPDQVRDADRAARRDYEARSLQS